MCLISACTSVYRRITLILTFHVKPVISPSLCFHWLRENAAVTQWISLAARLLTHFHACHQKRTCSRLNWNYRRAAGIWGYFPPSGCAQAACRETCLWEQLLLSVAGLFFMWKILNYFWFNTPGSRKLGYQCNNFLHSFSLGPYWDPLTCDLVCCFCSMLQLESVTLFFKSSLLWSSKAVLVCSRTMKKEDFTQKRVCDNGPDHHKPAAHLTHVHSMLDSSQNHSSSLQELCNTRNCSLFNSIPLSSVGKEMPLSFSESAGTNSSAAAPWKDSFHLHFSSGKDSLNRVSHCIGGISVTGWLEESCSSSGDFSSCCPGDNSVCFAQFWLGNLQYNKNLLFLESEMSSSKENELQFVFFKTLELGGLPDPCSNPVAFLNKSATGLSNNQKPHFFLCCLNLVSSELTLGYEQMLLNIQCVTNNFHIIQLVISVLPFALAGLWYAVVKVKKYWDFNN